MDEFQRKALVVYSKLQIQKKFAYYVFISVFIISIMLTTVTFLPMQEKNELQDAGGPYVVEGVVMNKLAHEGILEVYDKNRKIAHMVSVGKYADVYASGSGNPEDTFMNLDAGDHITLILQTDPERNQDDEPFAIQSFEITKKIILPRFELDISSS